MGFVMSATAKDFRRIALRLLAELFQYSSRAASGFTRCRNRCFGLFLAPGGKLSVVGDVQTLDVATFTREN
jgi:hypothetical protein